MGRRVERRRHPFEGYRQEDKTPVRGLRVRREREGAEREEISEEEQSLPLPERMEKEEQQLEAWKEEARLRELRQRYEGHKRDEKDRQLRLMQDRAARGTDTAEPSQPPFSSTRRMFESEGDETGFPSQVRDPESEEDVEAR